MLGLFKTHFVIRMINKLAVPTRLVVEPWGGEYDIPPSDSLDLVAEGDRRHVVEIEVADDRLVVSSLGSVGATITVHKGGKQIIAQ